MPTMNVGEATIEVQRITLRTQEAADVVDWSKSAIDDLVESGRLRDVSFGGARRLDPEEFARFVESEVQTGSMSHMALVRLAKLMETPR